MNAVEEIQAAIEKLTKLRHTDEPWTLAGGNEWIRPIGITVAPDDGGVTPREAEMIVTLHATVEPQLAVLQAAATRQRVEFGRSVWTDTRLDDIDKAALNLARTINGTV